MARNDPSRRLSDEKSRKIAEVCGKPSDYLVMQAQIDDMSETLRAFYRNILEAVGMAAAHMLPQYDPEQVRKTVDSMSINELVKLGASLDLTVTQQFIDNVNQARELADTPWPVRYEIMDDSMVPALPKGGNVILDTAEYQDGDMLCYSLGEQEGYQIRQAYFLDNHRTVMIPSNPSYETQTLHTDTLVIHGKVVQLVVDF